MFNCKLTINKDKKGPQEFKLKLGDLIKSGSRYEQEIFRKGLMIFIRSLNDQALNDGYHIASISMVAQHPWEDAEIFLRFINK